jgi:hypothetical protein
MTHACALREKVEAEIVVSTDLSDNDPFSDMVPEGNDYRTGYKDGLRRCARRLRAILAETEGSE